MLDRSLQQVFFVIKLKRAHNEKIHDPDPLITCDLMDGRDAFLTMARERHYEFSSLRRAKFSSLCMLCELHNQGQDRFVYTCNECKHHVETRYHCTVCEVCYKPWRFFSNFFCLYSCIYIFSISTGKE